MRNQWTCALSLMCLVIASSPCLGQRGGPPASTEDGPLPVAVRWWGQSCISVETFWGFTIVIDPYGQTERLTYPKLDLSADVVLITHEHFDHAGFEAIQGKPTVFHGLNKDGNWADIDVYLDRPPNQADAKVLPKTEAGKPSPYAMHIQSIRAFHDAESGAKRGKNAMFLIETDGVRILHCGDLGQPTLTDEQLTAIGPVDLLIIPVGGTFTVDAAAALAIVKQVKPRRWVWPIHFKTEATVNLPLASRDAFIDRAKEAGMAVRQVKGNAIAIARLPASKAADAPKPGVIVADYKPVKPLEAVTQSLEAMRRDRQALIDALGKVSKAQLDHKPSDKTHTIRWNFEHTTMIELAGFSQMFHAVDAEVPVINWRPAQMPPDFKPRRPDWDTAEMVRQVKRVQGFVERFSYLLAETPPEVEIEGTRFSLKSQSNRMIGHYKNHTTKAVKKFDLPDWPKG